MNKKQLVEELTARTGLTSKNVYAVLDALTDTVVAVVADGDTVQLSGFGTFGGRDRAARMGHNPGTGEKVSIPARRVPKFRPAPAFQHALRGDNE